MKIIIVFLLFMLSYESTRDNNVYKSLRLCTDKCSGKCINHVHQVCCYGHICEIQKEECMYPIVNAREGACRKKIGPIS